MNVNRSAGRAGTLDNLHQARRKDSIGGMNRPLDMMDLKQSEVVADVLLCRKDVMRLLGISSTQFWRLRRFHGFPAGIRLSPGIERWRLSDVRADIERRASERNGTGIG